MILDGAGEPQVRLVPVESKRSSEAERIVASRRAALGMYKHLVGEPIRDIRDLKITDAELDESERRKLATFVDTQGIVWLATDGGRPSLDRRHPPRYPP